MNTTLYRGLPHENYGMKIIHVTQHLGIGGLEKIIFHILQEQAARGHDVSIYVYDFDRQWVEFFRKNGIKVITPPLKKPGYDVDLIKQFQKDLFGADIIHTHDMNPMMYLFPIYFIKKLFFLNRPKLIHTTHGLGHIDRVSYYKYFEKIVIPIADKIIGVSKKIGDFYRQELWIGKNKVRVIENGIKTYDAKIDTNKRNEKRNWLINRHQLNPDLPIILSLSRVVPLKDQKFLINTFKMRPNYQLIIAGPSGDDEYYKELELLQDKNIKLIGAQELVSDYNMGADLYVSASTHEGIPVAVLEAMAVETPCLVSNIPGHLTLNQFDEVITTYQIHDVNDFLTKLDSLISTPNLNKSIKARKVVEENFSVKQMVDQYMLEYEK